MVDLVCLCKNEHLGLRTGAGKGVSLPRKQFQFLAAPSNLELIVCVCCCSYSAPAAWHHLLFQAHSFLWHRHLAATAVPTSLRLSVEHRTRIL